MLLFLCMGGRASHFFSIYAGGGQGHHGQAANRVGDMTYLSNSKGIGPLKRTFISTGYLGNWRYICLY